MSLLSDSSRVKATNQAVHCDIEDETVILGLKNGIYYGLNHLGAFIWGLIQEPKMVTEIHDAIMEEYDVEEEICRRDLINLLNELIDNGLIEVDNQN